MTGILKDFTFAIAYLDDIIIFSRPAEEHLTHNQQGFEKLRTSHHSMKLSKCHFFLPRRYSTWTHSQHKRHLTTSIKHSSYQEYATTKNAQTDTHFSQLSQILQEIYQEFC